MYSQYSRDKYFVETTIINSRGDKELCLRLKPEFNTPPLERSSQYYGYAPIQKRGKS